MDTSMESSISISDQRVYNLKITKIFAAGTTLT